MGNSPFPDYEPSKSLGMSMYVGGGVWKSPAPRPQLPITIEEIIRSLSEGAWTDVIRQARAKGETHAEVELGDPSTASGLEFYEGCMKYLSENLFDFEEVTVPASGTTGARLIARITL